jgi:DNA end-binding protein Ku
MARAIWSGSVSFGLVNVPVKLYSAVRKKDVHFHQLDEKSGARVRNKRVSEDPGREVPYEKIVKGYEVSKGHYVVVTPDDLEAMAPEDTRVIDIEDFVELAEVDPMFFDATYWLAVDGKGASKSYALLVKAMDKAGKVGIGRFTMRGKQHLAAIRPIDGALALHTVRFADEIVDRKDIEGTSTRATVTDRELKAAGQLIDSLTSEWKPAQYHDTYREQVEDLVARKAKGDEIVAEPKAEEDSPKVLDLMAALEASIADRKKSGGGRKKAASRKKAAPSKRTATRKSA